MRYFVIGASYAVLGLGIGLDNSARTFAAAPDQIKSVRADEIGTEAQILGRLGKPMDTMITVRGVWHSAPIAPAKPDIRLRFQVTEVDGRPLSTPIEFVEGLVTVYGKRKPKARVGDVWELRAFETGQFRNSEARHWEELDDGPPRSPVDWGQRSPFVSELTGVVKSVVVAAGSDNHTR